MRNAYSRLLSVYKEVVFLIIWFLDCWSGEWMCLGGRLGGRLLSGTYRKATRVEVQEGHLFYCFLFCICIKFFFVCLLKGSRISSDSCRYASVTAGRSPPEKGWVVQQLLQWDCAPIVHHHFSCLFIAANKYNAKLHLGKSLEQIPGNLAGNSWRKDMQKWRRCSIMVSMLWEHQLNTRAAHC